MKSFLEEYGITIVVATVIMGLIGTATFFKNTGGNSLKDMTNRFMQEAQLTETIENRTLGKSYDSLDEALSEANVDDVIELHANAIYGNNNFNKNVTIIGNGYSLAFNSSVSVNAGIFKNIELLTDTGQIQNAVFENVRWTSLNGNTISTISANSKFYEISSSLITCVVYISNTKMDNVIFSDGACAGLYGGVDMDKDYTATARVICNAGYKIQNNGDRYLSSVQGGKTDDLEDEDNPPTIPWQ